MSQPFRLCFKRLDFSQESVFDSRSNKAASPDRVKVSSAENLEYHCPNLSYGVYLSREAPTISGSDYVYAYKR